MKIKIPKPYIFIGTLVTAGVIVGITYNIIQANNKNIIKNGSTIEKQVEISQNVNDTELYDNLQKQIDELKKDIENTKIDLKNTNSELEKTKQQLENSNSNVSYLKSKLNNMKNTSNDTMYIVDNSKTQEIAEKVENISIKDDKQKELVKEKEELEKECEIYRNRTLKGYELEREKSQLEHERDNLPTEIKVLKNKLSDTYISDVNKQIEILTLALNSTTIEKKKKEYTNVIEKLKSEIETYNKNKIEVEIEKLEQELVELEKVIQKDNEEIKKVTLSEEEEERYSEISKRIGQINEELLKY